MCVCSPYLLGICAYMLLFTITSTFAYFEQGRIVSQGLLEESRRTAFFARMDKWANLLAVTLQVLVTSRLLTGLGVAATAALLPLLTAGGFLGLALQPGLGTILWFQVTRRATEYAVGRPTREVLFTVVRRDEKYKAKSLIDTLMYRGGDVLGALLYPLLRSGAHGWLAPLAAVPLALAWAVLSVGLGLRYRAKAKSRKAE